MFPLLSAEDASSYVSFHVDWDPTCDLSIQMPAITAFRDTILDFRTRYGRLFPWQQTRDPWAILLSEVMLQQTTTSRVEEKYRLFLEKWPTPRDLSRSTLDELLAAWSGLGYNRRALALYRTACATEQWNWTLPSDKETLLSLPGIGPSTAAAIRCFSYGIADVYLETNVRRVLLHCFFPSEEGVKDNRLIPILQEMVSHIDDIRQWYYALMDYGVLLSRLVPNPNRRSASYTRQAAFKGSDRELRGRIIFLATHQGPQSLDALAAVLEEFEMERIIRAVDALQKEGFLEKRDGLSAAESTPVYGLRRG